MLILLGSVSCEKVINVNLNESNPQYVIEAILLGGVNDFEVRVTQTTNYFDTTPPKIIENAVVTLTDENQNAYTLQYEQLGMYRLSQFNGLLNVVYTLRVDVGGKTFVAQGVIPDQTAIENVTFEVESDPFEGGEEQSVIKVSFQDPPNIENFYRVNSFSDALTGDNSVYRSDLGFDGQVITETLTNLNESGDTIVVELRSIHKSYYEYFNTLDNAIGDGGFGGGAAPANPTTNWSNNALGYFGCGNSSFQLVTVP